MSSSPPLDPPARSWVRGVARSPVAPVDDALAGWHPVDLAADVATAAIARAGLGADQVDELIVGCAEPVGAQGATVARAVVLAAGWPVALNGYEKGVQAKRSSARRACGSGATWPTANAATAVAGVSSRSWASKKSRTFA